MPLYIISLGLSYPAFRLLSLFEVVFTASLPYSFLIASFQLPASGFLFLIYISLSDILIGINSSISQEWPPAAHMLAMV